MSDFRYFPAAFGHMRGELNGLVLVDEWKGQETNSQVSNNTLTAESLATKHRLNKIKQVYASVYLEICLGELFRLIQL